jgi:hypothetical protein
MSINGDAVDRTAYALPVPKAKNDPSRVFTETLDDNVVMLDAESMHYHTLNTTAAKVWELCDGSRSIIDITNELRASGVDTTEEAVSLAVAQLGEAELLEATPTVGDSRLHRRRVLKMAAAGLIGAGALPLVESVTVPYAASAQTGCGCASCSVCVEVNLPPLVDISVCGFGSCSIALLPCAGTGTLGAGVCVPTFNAGLQCVLGLCVGL